MLAARIKKAREEGEGGFTLIELLVVMIIIGILAAIAIPVFLNQKKKATETSAKADATNISKEVAAVFVDGTPSALTIAQAAGATTATITSTVNSNTETTDVKVTSGNTASITWSASDAATYCVHVKASSNGEPEWSAGNNGIAKGDNCP